MNVVIGERYLASAPPLNLWDLTDPDASTIEFPAQLFDFTTAVGPPTHSGFDNEPIFATRSTRGMRRPSAIVQLTQGAVAVASDKVVDVLN